MTLSSLLHALDDVAADLPFAVGDYAAANDLYHRWRNTGSDEDHELLTKWLFCYTRRYFITKWMQQADLPVVEMEEPLSQAFNRCRRHLHRVQSHDTFASYVSVICKNTFLNFCRRRQRHLNLSMEELSANDEAHQPADPLEGHDRAILIAALHRAVDRLPEWLRTPARLRLLEDLDYDEIIAQTGLTRATLRSYVNKAILRLREDPEIALLLKEWEE